MVSHGDNRRLDTRFSMTLAVCELGERRAVMMASNVSAGGLTALTRPLESSVKNVLEVDLCDGRLPLVIPARVVRQTGIGAGVSHAPRFEMLGLRKSGLN